MLFEEYAKFERILQGLEKVIDDIEMWKDNHGDDAHIKAAFDGLWTARDHLIDLANRYAENIEE